MPDTADKQAECREAWRRWRTSRTRRCLVGLFLVLAISSAWSRSRAQEQPNLPQALDNAAPAGAAENAEPASGVATNPRDLVDGAVGRQGLVSTIQIMLLLTIISLAPAVLLMTTSFIRIVVVLGLLRRRSERNNRRRRK